MTAAHIKLIIAVLLDIADFTLGRVFGFGTAMDIVFTLIAVMMFGWKGLIQIWEVVDMSDQIDGFVPTLTLLALTELRQSRKDQDLLDGE